MEEALLSLLSMSLEALDLIEKCRQEVVPELKDLTTITLTTIKVCRRGVTALRIGRQHAAGQSHHRAAAASTPPAGSLERDSVDLLAAYLARACRTLRLVLEQAPNYFGIFQAGYYLRELALLQWSMLASLQGLDSPPSRQRQRPLGDATSMVEEPAARAFWTKCFGGEVDVAWPRFRDAFVAEFGKHPDEALTRFMEAVCGHAGGRVTVDRYGSLTKEADGIYELFQLTSDPHTSIFVMGTVEDDSHGNNISLVPVPLTSFLGYSIEQVSCGGQHAAILTTAGHIYTFGRGGFGRLGHGEDSMCSSPKLVAELAGKAKCKQVACGFAYTAAVTVDGQVYTWGAGENGRLGLGDERDKLSPCLVEMGRERVKQIFAGSVHTCALLETGHVYSWGKSEYTGHGFAQDVLSPLLLDGFDGQSIVQISVGPGGYHTIALSASGDVFTWGHNRVGQLGYTNTETVPRNHEGAFFLPTPQVVESLHGTRVAKVIAGWGHSAVVCQNGDVYICGRNFMGQLGLGDPENFQKNERQHPYLSRFCLVQGLRGLRVRHFACGGEHSAAVLTNGDVYTFGAGTRGQLGHGLPSNEFYPRLNKTLRESRRSVKDLACGNNCTLVLVGSSGPPSLQELCIESMAANYHYYHGYDLEDLLPLELHTMLQRCRNVPMGPPPPPPHSPPPIFSLPPLPPI